MSLQGFETSMGPPRVAGLMRRRFLSVGPADTLDALFELMRLARVRHVPVVTEGILIGLLSYRDVMEAALDRLLASSLPHGDRALRGVAAEQLMRGRPTSIAPDETLSTAATRMLALRLGCLPVVEPTDLGPKIVGLLTEADLLRAAYSSAVRPDASI